MTVLNTEFGLSDAMFRKRLAETIAWCSAQVLVAHPEEDAKTIWRRDTSRRASELLSLAYRTDPSLFESRSWFSRLINWPKIRRASRMKAEVERLLAVADAGSIVLPLRGQLRSSAFRSYAAALFQSGENRTDLVENLAERRASFLRDLNTSPTEPSDLAAGRLLVYEPDLNVDDGASEYISRGYFDAQAAPPWDTWVCYADRQLISWVPPSLLSLVQAGIAVNPVDCIRILESSCLSDKSDGLFTN